MCIRDSHWLVVIGLGTVWILDGLEVTIVGSMSEALKPPDTGLGLSSFGVGIGAALMVAGGVVEILVGVKAEQQTLESIARPLTAEESADEARPAGATV